MSATLPSYPPPMKKRTVHDVIKEVTNRELIDSLRMTEMTDEFEKLIIREALARIIEGLFKS